MKLQWLSMAIVALICSTSASAQPFNYFDFSSTANLSLNGSALQVGNFLRLTGAGNQTASVFRSDAWPISSGFSTQFTFRILTPPGALAGQGMAFVIHRDPAGATALGGSVEGLGYGMGANAQPGLFSSLAIEIDTRVNAAVGDLASNTISVHTRGAAGNNENEAFSLGSVVPPVTMANGQVHTMLIQYFPGILNIYIDNLGVPALSIPYDLVAGGLYTNNTPAPGLGITSGLAYVGFTASTGQGSVQSAEINYWTWNSTNTISVRTSQTTTPGSPFVLVNNGLTPGNEYFNLFSVDLCPGGPGTGSPSILGACLITPLNISSIQSQLQFPLGTPPFHFIANSATVTFGPLQIPPVSLDALCIDVTSGIVSQVTRITIL